MSDLLVVPATAALIEAYYGKTPSWTMHARVALLDGEPVGIGGIQFFGSTPFAFSEMKEALRCRLKDRARCVRAMEPILHDYNGQSVWAVAEQTTGPLLMRLGFQPTGEMARMPLISGGELMGTLMVRT
jgi:hypothetical protein